jgi:GT2 family glycosyltransferase/glycosyltransferase involved in cell wall biosynthesis
VYGWYFSKFGNPAFDGTAYASFSKEQKTYQESGLFQPKEVEIFKANSAELGKPSNKPGIVFLSVIDWGFRFQRPQQIATQYASRGFNVSFVNVAFSRDLMTGNLSENLTLLRLPGPPGFDVYHDVMSEKDLAKMEKSLFDYLLSTGESSFIFIVQSPIWHPLVEKIRANLNAPKSIIYDCMDRHSGFDNYSAKILGFETAVLGEADLVLATSRPILEDLKEYSAKVALVRNAADVDHFHRTPNAINRNSKFKYTVGYFGAIAEWFDTELMLFAAKNNPEIFFELIGSTHGSNVSLLEELENVKLLGEIPYQELPGAIDHWDSFVIPFKINQLTTATNPVKIYEMFASGRPVVATQMPELLEIDEGLVHVSTNKAEFSHMIQLSIETNTTELTSKRKAYASENSWSHRYQEIEALRANLEPKVSICVVTFNNLELNKLCIESVLGNTEYQNLELIVIDNGSTDGTKEYLEHLDDNRLRVVINEENRGFARANNQAISQAEGEYICLLNNDTVVAGPWLKMLVQHCQANPNLGLVGPVTNAIGNEAKIPVGYDDISLLSKWFTQNQWQNFGKLSDISMLAFFCVLIPKFVIESVGLLDERFETGMFEDDDYNRRVRDAGFDVKLAKDVFVHHWHHASFKLLGSETFIETLEKNREKYLDKWGL